MHRLKTIAGLKRNMKTWSAAPVNCPKCGSALVERRSRKNKIVDLKTPLVWGCTGCDFEMPAKRKPRIRSRFTDYNGARYQSEFEAQTAVGLDLRLRGGDILSWRRQVKIALDVNGIHVCNYYIDFVAERKDGVTEYIETKGYATDLWKFKWRLFEALMNGKPDIELIIVKQRI